MSGTFNPFNVVCKQRHRNTLNSFLNGTKNGDINGTCKWTLNSLSTTVNKPLQFGYGFLFYCFYLQTFCVIIGPSSPTLKVCSHCAKTNHALGCIYIRAKAKAKVTSLPNMLHCFLSECLYYSDE